MCSGKLWILASMLFAGVIVVIIMSCLPGPLLCFIHPGGWVNIRSGCCCYYQRQKNKHTLWSYSQKVCSILLGCHPHSHSNGEKPKEHIVSFWVLSIPCPLCWGFSSPGNLKIKESNQPSAEQHVQNTRLSDLRQNLSWFQRVSHSHRGFAGVVCLPRYFPRALVLHCTPRLLFIPSGSFGLQTSPCCLSLLFSAGSWLHINKWGSEGQCFSTECSKTLFRSQAHAAQT